MANKGGSKGRGYNPSDNSFFNSMPMMPSVPARGAGKTRGYNPSDNSFFNSFNNIGVPSLPSSGFNNNMFGSFKRMPARMPSLQQQYAGLNQGVMPFQPLGIRGYAPQLPPIFGGPVYGGFGGEYNQGGFSPFSYNAFGGNPFNNQPVQPLQPVQPQLPPTGGGMGGRIGESLYDYFGDIGDMGFERDYMNNIPDIPSIPEVPSRIQEQIRQNDNYDRIENQVMPMTTQVVEGGADIKVPFIPQVDTPVNLPQVNAPVNLPQMDAPINLPQMDTPINLPTSSFNPLASQTVPMSQMSLGNIGGVAAKSGGGRVQGFAEGGMPEENQTSERLEEETIMALMGKHPNPKEVYMRYIEVYGEEGLINLAAEVEQMMASQGRIIEGQGGGVDDAVPAMIDGVQPAALSKDEYVIPADVVAHAGDGSSEAGGKKFDELVSRVRKNKTGNTEQPEQIEFEEEITKVV